VLSTPRAERHKTRVTENIARSAQLRPDSGVVAGMPRTDNRLRRLPAIAAATLALLGASMVSAVQSADAAPAPQTLKKAVWGLQDHNGQSMFPIYKDLGIGIFQTQVRWDQVAPTKPVNPTDPNDPAYEWPSYVDTALAGAEQNGMTVMLQIIGAPTWANGGREYIYPATNPKEFGDFATAISKKYPTVRHWMIWGEPNSKRGFGPVVNGPLSSKTKLKPAAQEAPKLYAQLLDAAYAGLKLASPNNLVIGGNTYQGAGRPVIRTYQWLRYLRLPNGARPRMDMWGHNPYTYRQPDLKDEPSERGRVDFSDLGRLVKAVDKAYKGQRLKLFLSEWGVPTGFDQDLEIRVKTKEAVKWVKSAMKIVRKSPISRRIYTLGWSVPVDTPRNPQGLLDRNLRPKATYKVFKKG
jgi:hypothetical protein